MAITIPSDSALSLSDLTAIRCDPLGLTPLPEDNRQRFLRFALAQKNNILLPLRQIAEVMQIAADDIFPVPDMPACILGICSWQGETLWLVDFDRFIDCDSSSQKAQPIVLVVQSAGRSLGLVVEQVGDIDLFETAQIHQETGLCSPSLEPFVLGYCPQQGGIVLDASAIINAPLWRSHGPIP